MNNYKEISPAELENAFKLIGKDWMLITASDGEKTNTMTASWGSMGVLWYKDICTVYIRPQRYTYEFVEKAEKLTLSFFDERYRDALKICGSVSGRDCDKFERAGLTLTSAFGAPIICEAQTVLICKKLYADDIKYDKFVDNSLVERCYSSGDTHRFYVCEIEKILRKI